MVSRFEMFGHSWWAFGRGVAVAIDSKFDAALTPRFCFVAFYSSVPAFTEIRKDVADPKTPRNLLACVTPSLNFRSPPRRILNRYL